MYFYKGFKFILLFFVCFDISYNSVFFLLQASRCYLCANAVHLDNSHVGHFGAIEGDTMIVSLWLFYTITLLLWTYLMIVSSNIWCFNRLTCHTLIFDLFFVCIIRILFSCLCFYCCGILCKLIPGANFVLAKLHLYDLHHVPL